jgi:prepilin-type N-terminal cleavage/methylation domain-containing protein
MTARTRQHGFTLVELLVAMAIFITIMGGVTVLFTGAIRTVRQGNQQMDLFSMGRGMMTVMERDMSAAFTARELGEYFQFYGRAEGFMFVGKLENGRLGRVTYVINPNADTREFETAINEPWQDVWERVVTLAADRARARGAANNAAVRAAQDDASAYFQSFYPAPSGAFVNLGDVVDDINRRPIDFTVRVRSYALLRYQEDVADLDTFQPIRNANSSLSYQWPYIDPRLPAQDRVDGSPEGVEEALYLDILNGIGGPGNDIRNAILFADPNSEQLHAINRDTVAALIAAKRREVWIRLLAGDAPPGVPGFWKDPNDPTDARPAASDYVIAERILVRAGLLAPDGSSELILPGEPGTRLDALLVPGIFNYGAIDNGGTEVYRRTFNALENLNASGYTNARQQTITYADFLADPADRIKDYDEALVRALGERRDAALLAGSPLAPRLPALISPGLWFMDASPAPGAADFRRWFTQTIEVPSATGRNVSPRVTARVQQG